ncbi:DUF4883 family protein [Caproiciproducens sp. MSJ-32]|uniref:DUF4883 family protein n=1 Tax=Caproiciproducens sp. MSJ-32 TaxID=2841527 RepID=UPI001C110A20|nr:DUF4883 family protein [Caproiciproducens sp. MSJ-32]MBU5454413.1 DUF4883 family protein [Caproiciproducens sp. MSJ-32]
MKKFVCYIIILIIPLFFISCNINSAQYSKTKSKPTPDYYTNEIYKKILNNEEYKLKVFDMDFYVSYDVNKEEHSILPEFFDAIDTENFKTDIDLPSSPKYKLIVEFSDFKYIINIYDEELISVYPWDGIYKEDILTMKNVPDYYNLYKFCEYIKKVVKGFEG